MTELSYITPEELSRYQEGYPAHVFDKDHKELLIKQGYKLHPIIISPEYNYIIRDNEDVTGLHLVRQK